MKLFLLTDESSDEDYKIIRAATAEEAIWLSGMSFPEVIELDPSGSSQVLWEKHITNYAADE